MISLIQIDLSYVTDQQINLFCPTFKIFLSNPGFKKTKLALVQADPETEKDSSCFCGFSCLILCLAIIYCFYSVRNCSVSRS